MVRHKKNSMKRKHPQENRKLKRKKKDEPVNKKSLFNRYKNKQKVEEEIIKKQQLENKLKEKLIKFSESEEEEELDVFGQLLSTFPKRINNEQEQINSDLEDSEIFEDSLSDTDLNNIEDINTEDNRKDLNNDKCTDIKAESDNEDELTVQNDPFMIHFDNDLSDELLICLNNTPMTVENITRNWPTLGNLSIAIPKPIQISSKPKASKISIIEEKTFTAPGTVPNVLKFLEFNLLNIKSQIHSNIVTANRNNLIKRDLEFTNVFTPLQRDLFAIINNYQDLYYPERSFSNADEIRYTYCLHIVNHMLKTRTKILHHNAKLAKKLDSSDEYRDQGLVRPKVLLIVPFKDAAYRVVKCIIDILVPKEAGQVVNKNRFEEDFTGGEIAMPRKNPKPEDYELTFSGNTDDTFRLGMTLTKKTLKLYTDFYSSDVIISSPLGLRMLVGAEGEEERDFDFLSSIEVLVMDQADVFLMQNWDHLLHVLDHFHLQPKKTHGTDFSRVRSWAVNGWSKYYRQTLIFSSVSLPELKSVLNKRCHNYAGKVCVVNPVELGTIRQVVLQVPQMFHRFNAPNPLAAVDARFDYFMKEILPKQKDPLMSHTLIYVPSYFDYVRIRNHFKKEDIGFVQICEYSKDAKIARARDMFFHTEAHFLLYSERVHFFRRLRMKGVRHIIFYQPPTYPHFYSEMCNLMQESNQNKYGGSEFNMTVSVLYCKYDLQSVCGLLGSERAAHIMTSDKTTHMYMTGE